MLEDQMALPLGPNEPEPTPQGTTIVRDTPEPPEARAALVTKLSDDVKSARDYWNQHAFKTMRKCMRFAAGHQWPNEGMPGDDNFIDLHSDRYIANITLRHVQTRTASIYGKNPKIVARRKERLLSRVWDGASQTLMAAMQAMQMGDPAAAMIVEDAMATMQQNQQMTNMAKTLELLFEHEIDEQPQPFKVAMKAVVRRALTTAVGYVKVGYQRAMALPPDVDAQIETFSQQLALVERVSADMADGDLTEDSAQAEQLRLAIQELANTQQIVVREGLALTYPHSTAIIPDTNCQQLRGFVGARWVAEEFFLTADQIKEIYKKDVGGLAGGTSKGESGARRYYKTPDGLGYSTDNKAPGNDQKGEAFFCVWEVYNRDDGMVYTLCDGYRDFLLDPGAPDVKLSRFWPWFPFVINEVYDESRVYPPSDVELMMDMQRELNRSRQGLREHRRAALPKTFARKGVLSQEDKARLESPTPHQIVELDSLQPNEDIKAVLQPHSGPSIDPALYDPGPVYEDYLRTLGQQEANLGGTSGATATEASIAEGSRVSSVSAVVDDLDEFLGEFARAAGEVLLQMVPKEKVVKVIGPGAVWPELDRESIVREIYLDIEAASTGRPNKAQEVQTAQAMFPLLLQIPGLSPEWLAKEMLRRMDDRLDLTDAFAPGIPSIMMMNRTPAAQPGGAGAPPTGASPEDDPNAQGQEGGNNAPSTEPPQVNAAPRPPGAGGVGRPPMVAPPGPGPV